MAASGGSPDASRIEVPGVVRSALWDTDYRLIRCSALHEYVVVMRGFSYSTKLQLKRRVAAGQNVV